MADRYKLLNGERIKLTSEENAQRDAEEKAWADGAFDRAIADLRFKRTKLLQDCDWTDLPNTPLTETKKTEWKSYRTKLRDITDGLDTVEKIKAVEFPTKPSE